MMDRQREREREEKRKCLEFKRVGRTGVGGLLVQHQIGHERVPIEHIEVPAHGQCPARTCKKAQKVSTQSLFAKNIAGIKSAREREERAERSCCCCCCWVRVYLEYVPNGMKIPKAYSAAEQSLQ